MKPPRTKLSLIAAAVACCFMPEMALANPVGPKVVHGNASFNQQGKLLTVTNSPGSIINWQGFSIAAGETTRFVQQSAASAVLNRVTGADASSILGALQSNGRVWLINPNGIIFGKGAQIDTAGLVASTLNVMNSDFLLGRMRFVDTPGAKSISNAGEIRTPVGGRVVLVSPEGVENSGIIRSPQGEVILAAGKTVELVDSANPEVRIEVAAPQARAINLGKIVAESGRVGIYGGLVVNRGVVSADSAVVGENGKIVFRATRDATLEAGSVTTASGGKGGSIEVQSEGTTLVSGTVRATGSAETGGQVSILGQNVGVIDQAQIDASGARGGGTVLVGGDLRGENPGVRNAQMTFLGSEASIKADAIGAGNGGKVIVWADDTTRSHGSISARGGAAAGDGGFVETSGKLSLSATRGPDVRAPAGKAGTWLIDPNDLEIVAGQVFDATTNTGAPFFSPLTDGSKIGVDLINAQLDFGSNVVINTTSRGPTVGTDLGNITLSASILKTASTATSAPGTVIGPTTLTLQAHNNIVIGPGGSIASTGDPLRVFLEGPPPSTFSSPPPAGGAITIGGGGIKTNGGLVQARADGAISIGAPIDTRNANGIGGGSVSLTSTAGAVNLASTITSGSNVAAQGQTGVNVAGPVTGSFFTGTSAAGAFAIAAGASISVTGATITANSMQFDGSLNAGASSVTLRQNTAGTPFFLGAESAGGVALSSAELANIVTTGSLFIGNTNTGPVTANGALSIAGPSQVSITSNSTFTQNAGATITSSAPMSITAPGGITLNAASSAPRFTFITNNAFAANQPVTSGSDIDVRTSVFGTAINLGVAAAGAGTLDMTSAQLSNLNTSASGFVRIGTTSSGPLTIQGPIAPAGTSNLRLASNSSISQTTGATITETNLGLQVNFGSINLPEANAVGTLAASLCCAGNAFAFKNAAATPLTIGTVDFISGVANFGSDATTTAMIQTDNLTVAAPMQFSSGTVTIKPVAVTKVDFGGADAPGVLGLSAGELGQISAGKLLVLADQADISAPIAPIAGSLDISPISAGRTLNIVAGTKNPANLEFAQSDIGNVTASSLQLGDATTGPVNVNTALTVPASIGTFGLQSGDATSGLMVNAAIGATNSVSLLADLMTLNALTSSSAGSLTVANTSAGRSIDLGTRTAGKLALSTTEIQSQLSAPAGTITFGSSSAGNLTVSQNVSSAGSLTISAPNITLSGSVTSTAGNVTLIGDQMAIGATVNAPAGSITAHPLNFRSIDLGTDDTASVLGFTPAEINNFMPAAGGVLRFGDLNNTANITVRAAIAPANAATLSLVTDNGSVTQTAGSTITVSNLAARAAGNITLDQNNDTDTVAAQSNFGNISVTYFGTSAVNIGSVDGVTGVQTSGGNVTLRSDDFNITQRIDARPGTGTVTITALSNALNFDIGSTLGGTPALSQAELNLIGADTLFLGNANTGNFTVSAPVNITGGVNNLTITNSGTTTVSNALTVPGAITINSNAMTFAAQTTSGSGSILLRPQTAGTLIAVGGNDVSQLGLDATDLGNLLYGTGTLAIGSTTAGDMNVTFAGTLPGSVALATGGQATFNSSTFSAANALSITANKMSIPGANGISAPGGVFITTATAGRNMTIGTTPGVATDFELSLAEINKISIAPGAGTLEFDTSGSLTTTAPLAFTMVPNVELSGGTLVHTGGALSAPGAITFRANNMPSAAFSTVSSTGGGRVTFAPRDLRAVNVGTNPAGSALGIASSQLGQVSTSGVVQIGDPTFTSSVTFSAPTAQPAGSSALTVIASQSISQAAGAPITASNLNLTAGSFVNLPAANAVGTLAGSSSGSFNFTTSGTLNIATVDGLSGINDGTIGLFSDGIVVSQPIIGNTTTLAPRIAGTPINMGSGSGYVITDAAVDQITSSTLNIGNNTSGPISVNSAVDRSSGNLILTTAPGSSITVSAPLGSATTSGITMNTGLGGTVNIGGAVLASQAISVIGKTITTNAPITSSFSFSNVTLGAAAGDTASVLTVNQPVSAGNNITFTADSQSINAALTAGNTVTLQPRSTGTPVVIGGSTPGSLSIPASTLAMITADQVTIGNSSSGDLTVISAIGPFAFDSLSLTSGGNVTQTAGSTITVRNTSSSGLVTGSLNISATGQINLPELNDIAMSVSGSAGGTGNNFQFNNLTPLKLQNVVNVSASGKVIINAPPGDLVLSPPVTPPIDPVTPPIDPVPPPPPGTLTSAQQEATNTTQAAILGAVDEAQNVQEKSDKAADARKADGEKSEADQDKQEGRKSCG